MYAGTIQQDEKNSFIDHCGTQTLLLTIISAICLFCEPMNESIYSNLS